ncbi:DUF6207 family protein [Streptomyces sp. NPDC001388]
MRRSPRPLVRRASPQFSRSPGEPGVRLRCYLDLRQELSGR